MEGIFEIIAQFIGYYTAVFLIPILTFNKIYIESRELTSEQIEWRWKKLFGKTSQGKIVVNGELGGIIGLIIWMILIALGIIIYSYR